MELGDAIRSAVTTRYFKPDPVPADVLNKAFDYARWAPQGGNRQPVTFITVTDPDHRKQLRDLYLQPWKAYLGAAQEGDIAIGSGGDSLPRVLRNADHMAEHLHEVPAIVVVCWDPDGVHPTDTELGHLSIVGGGSVYPAVQNFILGCREQGLGTALTTLLCIFEPQVKEMLGIPDHIHTAAHIAVGYRTTAFPTKLDRKPLSEMAFDGQWGTPMPGL